MTSSDPIGARLATPARSVTLRELPGIWFHHTIAVTCRICPAITLMPPLHDMLRRAIGRQLMRTASPEALAGRPCPWRPACALDPLFLSRRMTAGLEVPKPLVITVEAADHEGAADHEDAPSIPGQTIVISVTTFGFATAWADAVGDALIAALREGGITEAPLPPTTFEVLARTSTVADSTALPQAPATAGAEPWGAVLTFTTPLVGVVERADAHGVVTALTTSLGNRLSGLARWCDAAVAADWRSLRAMAEGVPADVSGLEPWTGGRGAGPRRGKGLHHGWLGEILVPSLPTRLLPLFALGARAGAGARTAMGYGRYSLALFPPAALGEAGNPSLAEPAEAW